MSLRFHEFQKDVPGRGVNVQRAEFSLPNVTAIVLNPCSAVIQACLMIPLYGMEQHHSVEQAVEVVVILLCAGGKVGVEMDRGAGQEASFCVDNPNAGIFGHFWIKL